MAWEHKTCVWQTWRKSSAISIALAWARAILSAIVFIPRRSSHASNGANPDPSAFWMKWIRFPISSSLTQTIPPIVSEWPDMNLVAECITMSAPRSNGTEST